MKTLVKEWHNDLDKPLTEWLAVTVKDWADITDEQANAWWVAALDSLEDQLTAPDGPHGPWGASFEVGIFDSVTGRPETFNLRQQDYTWAIVEGEED